MTTTRKNNDGFTLIELMLAMAFISFMLLFMVAAILQITHLYVKGSAIRQINQTGRQLLVDVGSALRASGEPIAIDANNRLCTGTTSYVWNMQGNSDGKPINTFSAPNASTELRFVSVQDQGGNLCSSPTQAVPKTSTTLDLVGPDITPLQFSVQQRGKLWDIQLVLSTAGSNVADPDASTITGFSCDAQNQFCALGDFQTSIYVKGR